ncbi:fimbrial protein [Cronobacter dublinensis]
MNNILLVTLLLAFSAGAAAAEDNVHFSGTLVSEPCTLPDADTDIKLAFGTVIEKYLYQYHRIKSQAFSIHLKDCDPTIMNSVSVTFEGTSDTELTTMLAPDVSSTAKGIAIGIELLDGTPVTINESSANIILANGTNVLTFNAFVQAKPTYLANKSLMAGDFTATVNFLLSYQ